MSRREGSRPDLIATRAFRFVRRRKTKDRAAEEDRSDERTSELVSDATMAESASAAPLRLPSVEEVVLEVLTVRSRCLSSLSSIRAVADSGTVVGTAVDVEEEEEEEAEKSIVLYLLQRSSSSGKLSGGTVSTQNVDETFTQSPLNAPSNSTSASDTEWPAV